jgi:hypothetical protein
MGFQVILDPQDLFPLRTGISPRCSTIGLPPRRYVLLQSNFTLPSSRYMGSCFVIGSDFMDYRLVVILV